MTRFARIMRALRWRRKTTGTILRWHHELKPFVALGCDTARSRLVIGVLIARLWRLPIPVPPLAMTIRGVRHAVSLADYAELAGAVEVFVNGDYEIGANAGEVERVLDLGANVGFATHFMHSLYPRAEIVAVEPAPDVYRRLLVNVGGLDAVRTLPIAVGPPGWVWMDLAFPSPERSLIASGASRTILRVSLRSLLAMLDWDELDILKLDIEGDEFAVLADAETVRRARIVVGELHLSHAPVGFAGVSDLLPGFVVHVKSQGSGNALFSAVRRDCVLADPGVPGSHETGS